MSEGGGDAPAVALVTPPPASEDAVRMLSAWTWLLPSRLAPVAVNRFGDWYLATPDGSICLLSIWEGTFVPVAASIEDWREWLATEEGRETNWCELVLLLFDRGQRLANGECFAFVPPPSEGAAIDIDRIMVTSVGAIAAITGQLFQQRRSV